MFVCVCAGVNSVAYIDLIQSVVLPFDYKLLWVGCGYCLVVLVWVFVVVCLLIAVCGFSDTSVCCAECGLLLVFGYWLLIVDISRGAACLVVMFDSFSCLWFD